MNPPTTNCCEEFENASRLSRRSFLAGAAAVSAGAVATTMFGDALRQAAFADTTGGNVVVVISMRGGIDGLGVVVPHGDPAYYTARPRIAVSADRLVAKDSYFGLHPNMAPLEWLHTSGELAAVHAVGMTHANRSHFLAMEEIEDADPTSSVRRGWVNRMVGLDAKATSMAAVNLGSSIVPTALAGPAPVMAAGSLDKITLIGGDKEWRGRRTSQLETMWGSAGGPLGTAARSALSTVSRMAPIATSSYKPSNGASYAVGWPATDLADALADTAHLIRADVGTEVVTIDYGSWDMHSDYGTTQYGDMQSMVLGFAKALNAFMRDLGSLRSRVTVVTLSEFGRRIAENGNMGLDHGWGNMMLVAGGGVKGGQYYGKWPGLGAGKNVEGDLAVTTDYRNVLGEIIASRFPRRSVSSVFPGLVYRPLHVMS